jgi:hypothetical protein
VAVLCRGCGDHSIMTRSVDFVAPKVIQGPDNRVGRDYYSVHLGGSEEGIERLNCSLFRERTRKVKQFCVQRFLFSDDVRERRRSDLSALHADKNTSFTGQ